jgi:hypothetical protein
MAQDYEEIAADLETGAIVVRHPELLSQKQRGRLNTPGSGCSHRRFPIDPMHGSGADGESLRRLEDARAGRHFRIR